MENIDRVACLPVDSICNPSTHSHKRKLQQTEDSKNQTIQENTELCFGDENEQVPSDSHGTNLKSTQPIKHGTKSKKIKGGRKNIRDVFRNKVMDSTTLALREQERERLMSLGKNTSYNDKELCQNQENTKNKTVEVICLDSDSEGDNDAPPKTSWENSSPILVLSSDSEEEEKGVRNNERMQSDEYYSDLGLHTNDVLNVPNSDGQVLVNVNHPSNEEDIFVPEHLSKVLKPHQIGGLRFLHDNLIKSASVSNASVGYGCILAHAMGLGKTIQTITFIDIFLRHTQATKVLCVVPVNTIQNWMSEFNTWLPCKNTDSVTVKMLMDELVDVACMSVDGFPRETVKGSRSLMESTHRSFNVYMIDSQKNFRARAYLIGEWEQTGGVLLLGYEMYRSIVLHTACKSKARLKKGKNTVFDENISMLGLKNALCNPGPDLVVCDEGHRIRNYQSFISTALKSIKTRKRLVLTGYPLQNNLVEYWCMVDFVRPNYLGSRQEFSNMFERPIMNGQCVDSTKKDKHLMRQRAHVLFSLLQGFVQRRGHDVLKTVLPPKEEHVLMVRLSPIQKELYKKLIELTSIAYNESLNPIKTFSLCCKIWNHPDILYKAICADQQGKPMDIISDQDDISIDEQSKRRKKINPYSQDETSLNCSEAREALQDFPRWAGPIFNSAPYIPNTVSNSGKFTIMHQLINECCSHGDKMLVFSQSLLTLTAIEEMLHGMKLENGNFWKKGRDYYRLDGSTGSLEREKLVNSFNNEGNREAKLFLLSTRAGCLGINLVAANRVVVFDVSWNPCHDAQAVCRIYRYGQKKPCYIYRLVSSNTMEKKIYYRQISKQGISDRVVDEMSLTENFSKSEIQSLMLEDWVDEAEMDYKEISAMFKDHVLWNTLWQQSYWITQVPFKHESLLINENADRLNNTQKQEAKRAYESEKRKELWAGYRSVPLQRSFPRDTPVAPVRPFLWRPPTSHYSSHTLTSQQQAAMMHPASQMAMQSLMMQSSSNIHTDYFPTFSEPAQRQSFPYDSRATGGQSTLRAFNGDVNSTANPYYSYQQTDNIFADLKNILFPNQTTSPRNFSPETRTFQHSPVTHPQSQLPDSVPYSQNKTNAFLSSLESRKYSNHVPSLFTAEEREENEESSWDEGSDNELYNDHLTRLVPFQTTTSHGETIVLDDDDD